TNLVSTTCAMTSMLLGRYLMSLRLIALLGLSLCLPPLGANVGAAEPAAPATYKNPIVAAGNPADPHVIRVGDTYYLYATTHGRGYDVLTSKDLVHWENQGSCFDDPRGGAWAPDVFHNVRGDGKFYLYYTDNNPHEKPGPL